MIRLLAVSLLLVTSAAAEETAAFLKLGVGARALGMGGAFTAIADDASAIAWNPAGLSRVRSRELSATHAALAEGARYDFIAYAQSTSRGTFSGAAAHLAQAPLEGRDDQGRPIGGFSASDSMASFGYSARLFGPARLGGAVKLVQSRIAEASGQTFAVDLGGQYDLGMVGPGGASFGIAIQNMGPGLRIAERSTALPMTIAAGLGYRLPLGMTVSFDAKTRPNSSATEFAVGTEYALVSGFAVRGGYGNGRSLGGGAGFSAINGLSGGLGFRVRSYSVDYSLTPFGDLGNVQRLSLGAKF